MCKYRQIERVENIRGFQVNECLFVLDKMQIVDGEKIVARIQFAVGPGYALPIEIGGR